MERKKKEKKKTSLSGQFQNPIRKSWQEAKSIPSTTKTQDPTSSWIGTALH
jgi:hypothetical protein